MINPCFVLLCIGVMISPVFRKTGSETESCGVTINMHLKVPVQSKVPCMVIAVRDGICFVWQMFQHPVRNCY